MRGRIGDRLVVAGHRVGQVERAARILEVRGPDGTPPFRVRWEDTGSEAVVFPGSDAHVVAEAGEAPTRGPGRAA
ncbi:MAG: DUF1918 domain-containing protein, partial [Actinomycetota bacterium]